MAESTEGTDGIVWGYSDYDDEGFQGAYTSKEEAIEVARDEYGDHQDFYILRGRYADVAEFCPDLDLAIEGWLEDISEKAYEECGELAEDWPSVSNEQREELKESLGPVLKDWMRKHMKPPAWTPVGQAEKIEKLSEYPDTEPDESTT